MVFRPLREEPDKRPREEPADSGRRRGRERRRDSERTRGSERRRDSEERLQQRERQRNHTRTPEGREPAQRAAVARALARRLEADHLRVGIGVLGSGLGLG